MSGKFILSPSLKQIAEEVYAINKLGAYCVRVSARVCISTVKSQFANTLDFNAAVDSIQMMCLELWYWHKALKFRTECRSWYWLLKANSCSKIKCWVIQSDRRKRRNSKAQWIYLFCFHVGLAFISLEMTTPMFTVSCTNFLCQCPLLKIVA